MRSSKHRLLGIIPNCQARIWETSPVTGGGAFGDNSDMATVKLPADAKPLAREVHRLMVERSLSMRALAARAGVSYDFVRDIIRGQSKKPNAESLGKLAAFLDRTTEELINPGRPGQFQEDEKTIKTPEEFRWIRLWRRASDIGRDRLLSAAENALIGDLRGSGEAEDI